MIFKRRKPWALWHIRMIYVLLIIDLVAVSVTGLLLITPRASAPVNNEKPFTFSDCGSKYGIADSSPPICETPDGVKYTEFRLKGKTYQQCVAEGGKVRTGYCSVNKRTYQKYDTDVKTFGECASAYMHEWAVELVFDSHICVDQNGRMWFAGGENRRVNNFDECKSADGPISKNGTPNRCYYDGVVYYDVLKPSHKYLNPPYELETFSDCIRPGTSIGVKMVNGVPVCTAFNNKKYEYTGDPIDSFEDCARVMGFVLESNPPQCYGPDGTHYTGPRS